MDAAKIIAASATSDKDPRKWIGPRRSQSIRTCCSACRPRSAGGLVPDLLEPLVATAIPAIVFVADRISRARCHAAE